MLKEKNLLIGDSFEFHDVSTTSGRLQLLFHRITKWRWLPALSGLALVGLLTIVAASAAVNRGNHASEKLPRSLPASTDETGKPVLFSAAGPPPWVASKIAAKSKPVPPWLPSFLDQFPWVNKSVVDDLFAKADPASPSWIAPSTTLPAAPTTGGATKPVPTWLPGFLSNFPWINKSVIDIISSDLAAKAAVVTPSPILEARSIVKIKVRKPVPLWVPGLLKSTLMNKTIASKLAAWDSKAEAEAFNTLALKLAVQKVAAESLKTTKPLPLWLPAALASIPGVDKSTLLMLQSKAAAAAAAAAPKSKVPAWLPEYLDKFPWMNKTVVDKLQAMVDTDDSTGAEEPSISAGAPAPTLGVTGALPLSPEVISLLKAAGVSLVPVKSKGVTTTTTESSAATEAEVPEEATTETAEVTPKDLASFIDAMLSAPPATTAADTTTTPKPVPEWLPAFLDNLPWVNKTVVAKLKSQTLPTTTASLEVEETTTEALKNTKATKAPKKNKPTKPTTTPSPEAIAQQLLLQVAEGALEPDSSTTKPIPAWLPNFLDLFIPNKAIIAALKAKVAGLETTTAADLEAATEASSESAEPTEAEPEEPTKTSAEDSETTEASVDEPTETPEDSDEPTTEVPETVQVPPNATLIFWSDGTEIFPSLDTILTNVSDVLALQIHNFIIDAPTLSKDLAGMPALQNLTIEASRLIGHFSPVLLPNLQSFELSLLDTDLNVIDSDLLSSLLFPVRNESSDLLSSDSAPPLVPDIPDILLEIDGVKLLQVSDSTSNLLVNVPTSSCAPVLDSLDISTFDTVQLYGCPLTSSPALSSNLTVLTLHDALPTDQDVLDQLMSSLNSTSLKELHLYAPPSEDDDDDDPEVYILDLSTLPPTLVQLSLSGIDVTASSSDQPTALTELTLEKCNVSSEVLANWTILFPELTTINLLSLSETGDQQYPLLNQVLLQSSVQVVTVTGMDRQGYTDGASPLQDAVEKALLDLFVAPDLTDFILSLGNDTRYGQPLPERTMEFRRYSLMDFDEVESYPAYLKYDSSAAGAGALLGIFSSWFCMVMFALVAMAIN